MASGQEQQHGSVLGQQQQSAHTAPQQRGTRQQEATLRGTTLCRGTRPGLGGGADPHPPHSIRGGLRIAAAALQEGAFSAPFPSARAVNARSDSAVTHRRLRCRPRFPTERKRRCSRTGRRAAAAVPHRAREAPLRPTGTEQRAAPAQRGGDTGRAPRGPTVGHDGRGAPRGAAPHPPRR